MKFATFLFRCSSVLGLVALLAAAPASAQISMLDEDFSDVSDWSAFGTTVVTDGNIGTITATPNDWGKAEMSSWVTAMFGCGSDSLYVNCTGVTGHFKINIMEEVPPFTEITLADGTVPGIYTADVSALTGWTGQRSFKLVIWVEWATPGSASFDQISLANTAGWADDFDPADAGWRDENTNPGFNAIFTDIGGPYANIQESPGVSWGKCLSPVLTINVDDAPTLTAVVQSDEILSNFVFGIQEEVAPWQYIELGRGYDAGIFVYDYATITGWSGVHTFSILLGVESNDVDGWATFDSVKLDCSDAPTPVAIENTTWGGVKQLFR